MVDLKNLEIRAKNLIKEFKGDSYIFGSGCIDKIGFLAKKLGNKTLLLISQREWAIELKQIIIKSLKENGIKICSIMDTPQSNTPSSDVFGLQDLLVKIKPDFLTVVGGGSAIDCAKASAILYTLSPLKHDIEPFFGVGKVTEMLKEKKLNILPVLAVQTSASSAAHLTKYTNITDIISGQKKLIVDEAIIPPYALFDYSITKTESNNLTIDGVLDGISHLLEVYYGINYSVFNNNYNAFKVDKNNNLFYENFKKVEEIAILGLYLLVNSIHKVLQNPLDFYYRKLIGIGTDLGGYAIMIGGTNGGHFTSFSLVNILSHGRACGILNPYWTVFFAPAIKRQLTVVLYIFKDYLSFKDYSKESFNNLSSKYNYINFSDGYIDLSKVKEIDIIKKEIDKIFGNELIAFNDFNGYLGLQKKLAIFYNFLFDNFSIREVAEIAAISMLNFLKSLGVPTRLADVDGFNDTYIKKVLVAAHDPQLEMKLRNMPVSLSPTIIDKYLAPLLKAAKFGNLSLIKNL